MNDSSKEQQHSESPRPCAICEAEAVRLIFSNRGSWMICNSQECWKALTTAHQEDATTWIQRVLPEKPSEFEKK